MNTAVKSINYNGKKFKYNKVDKSFDSILNAWIVLLFMDNIKVGSLMIDDSDINLI